MRIAILDSRTSGDMRAALESRGFHTLTLPKCNRLPEAIASHPDMLMLRLGDILFVEEKYRNENASLFEELSVLLPQVKICPVSRSFTKDYPHDCILNALLFDSVLFAKTDTVAPEILAQADKLGIRVASVKQGYPACTVLALGERHAVTADRGMAKVLRAEGIEVMLINDGGILLPPYEYGFIGGASGVYGSQAYFLGDIKTHSQGDEIRKFCISAGYEPVSLGRGPLLDLGRIIFIDSEENDG